MNPASDYGITVLHEPDCRDDIVFDLVAIHGLNGDAFKTWTHKQSKIMWLRDLLPKELPNVRIMTFGYNSKFYNITGHQDLLNISMKLLSELVDVRSTEKEIDRPIVFVCHSLGGIVLKKALLIQGSIEEMAVQNATYGVIFFATPHNGSAVANAGKVLASIVDACSPFRPAQTLLSLLRKNSKALLEITNAFLQKACNLQIVSFFEMEMTRFGIFSLLVVEQRSAILNVPGEISIGQFANHRDIARFSSVADRNYRPVLTRLLRFTKDLAKICTLSASNLQGGAGKTNCALQYALRNRFKYKSGVVYFNASSKLTLMADFHRVHDLLNLGKSSDRIAGLKQWFSRPKNRNWLIIFDGVDDLQSVPVATYFPSCAWGHIVVTSRDQAVVGLIAPAGRTIDVLEERDAIGLLLEKAAIGNPSADDFKVASTIVRSLGCLPLAVDQAGAFIRRRGKTLSDYYRLLRTKQYEVLRATPGLVVNEKVVATVWELNFRQLEKESAGASYLLTLFSFLEPGNISELMLRRGSSIKKVWGCNGEIGECDPIDEGLDPMLAELLSDEMQLDYALQQLLAFSLIQRNNIGAERTFSVHPLVQQCASHRVPDDIRRKWQVQAILLVAHAFPSCTYVDEDFTSAGRDVFAHVPRILATFDQLDPDCYQYDAVKSAVCELILSTLKFHSNPWRRECIDRLRRLLKDEKDCYLKAWATAEESKVLRARGEVEESYKTLENFIRQSVLSDVDEDLAHDARWNSAKGHIIIAFGECLAKENELSRAQAQIEQWKPLNLKSPSTMERVVLRTRDVVLGRILRLQGLFPAALEVYEKLLREMSDEDYKVSSGWQTALFSALAYTYCEVGRPGDAEAALEKVLEVIYARGWENIALGKQTRKALSESFLRRGMFKKAELCLFELLPAAEAEIDPTMFGKSTHACLWIGLARISHLQGEWHEALDRWKKALTIVESMMTTGFTHGVVLHSIAQVQFQLGCLEESQVSLRQAKESLAFEGRKYWIVGLGTYWYDYVVTMLGKTGPSPVVV
ncbi:hypothetical protein LOZ57_001449 [Ophidiomyces ophidiicola]|uniref:uncharacterized protein n=1 Tax=Ophidiomyces ophidiicola TaxID=1387563 RepID=UPI0020C5A548|nr:uncharacterized protein LOZ57_001449 [Ophidiomyces ophidiicola]KAI1950901.1 hypothetical protein LOZ57_001449 [Ophidiomyces ophidiicola]